MKYLAAFAVLVLVLASGCTSTGKAVSQPAYELTSTTGVINACEAGSYNGKSVTVQGYIAAVFRSAKSNTIFMNFEKPYPDNCFTAVIFSSDLEKFPNFSSYEGKDVLLTGRVQLYQSKPEIILEDPSQIKVL